MLFRSSPRRLAQEEVQTTENKPKQLCSGFPLKVTFAGFGGWKVVSIESLNEVHPSEGPSRWQRSKTWRSPSSL